MLQHAKDFMNIRKVNSQTVEVIVPRLPAYAIDAPEEITLTIPAGSLTSRHPILASPSFQILTTVGSAFCLILSARGLASAAAAAAGVCVHCGLPFA